MLHSIAQTDTDLAAVFSRWYTGTTEHRMHFDSAYTKITANSGVDQGCPLSACGFSAVVDPTLHSIMAELCTLYDSGAKLFAYLDDWYLWIKPQCLLQTIAVITASTRSVNLALQSTKTQVWKGSCQDPIPPEFQDKVTLTFSCLGGHLQIHGDTEPSPVVVGEQATMEKTTQRFQKIATTLADLNAEGLNAQTVNDLLTMYVGAASQHVLRMSFVPEQEAQNFDRQVLTFWSRLMHRDITSPLFFLPLKLGGLGVGSAVQRHAAAPWRAWQSVVPSLMTTTQSPDTDSLFRSTPLLRAQLTQLQSTISQQMNKPSFQLKPLGAALRLQTTQKKQVSTIQRNIHKQFYNSLTDTPTEQAILLSQSTSHTGAHLMQPRSEAYEIEDRCFRVSVARRLMLPHPTKVRQVSFAINLLIRSSIIAMAADMEEVLIADMLHWRDVLRISFIRTVGSKYSLNKKYLPLLVLSMDRLNTLGWTLSSTLTVQSRIWMSPSLLPSLAIRPWCLLPAQNQDLWPRERRRPNLTGIQTSIWSRSFLRQLVDLVHMPGN